MRYNRQDPFRYQSIPYESAAVRHKQRVNTAFSAVLGALLLGAPVFATVVTFMSFGQ